MERIKPVFDNANRIAERVEAHQAISQQDLDELQAPMAELVYETLPPGMQELWRSAAEAGMAYLRDEARKQGVFYAPLPNAGVDRGQKSE